MLGITDEAGLRAAGCSEHERGWVPRRELESWLRLMHEVGLLRLPLVFGRAHAVVTPLSEGEAGATRGGAGGVYRWPLRASAASTVEMRSGRHFVRFTVMEGTLMLFGVIRLGWDVEGGANAFNVDGH